MTKAQIMKRAHEIARTLEGNYMARMSMALRQAWAEAKAPAKAAFNGVATINYQLDEIITVSVQFKKWENYGKHRIYFESTNMRAIKGFIDCDYNNETHIINTRLIGIEKVVDSFIAAYAI